MQPSARSSNLASLVALGFLGAACGKAPPPAPEPAPADATPASTAPPTSPPAPDTITAVEPSSDVSATPDGTLPWTPPRPLPDALTPAGERCVLGDGAACTEVADGIALRAPFPLASPWLERGCELGDNRACTLVSRHAVELLARLPTTIYSGTTLPGFQPVPLIERACQRGDWLSCSQLAELQGTDYCDHDPSERLEPLVPIDRDAPSEAADKALKATRTLAEVACPKGDEDACLWLALRLASGCGFEADHDTAMRLFAQALVTSGPRCADGDDPSCHRVNNACAAMTGAAVHLEKPASTGGLPIKWADASSTLPPWKGYRFDVGQLIDGSPTTSWQPLDKLRGGVGQWVELHFEAPMVVTGVAITNGLQKTDKLGDLFVLNNRVKRGDLIFSDGSRVRVELASDARGAVRFEFTPRRTASVKLEVATIWRGDKWNDLAISEIEILGARDESAPDIQLPDDCNAPVRAATAACTAGHQMSCDRLIALASEDNGKRDAAVTLALATAEAACATEGPNALRACVATALLLLAHRDEAGRARTLLERACAKGDYQACGELGCHGEIMGGGSISSELEPAPPATCDAGCKGGDVYSCLALFAAKHPGAIDDVDHPAMKRHLATLATCASAKTCSEEAAAIIDASETRYGILELRPQLELIAALDKACTFGDAKACADVAQRVDEGAFQVSREERACKLDPNCGAAVVAEDPEATKKTFHPKALVKACAAHDGASCKVACDAVEDALRDPPGDGDDRFLGDSPPTLEELAPFAHPEGGMTPTLLLEMCNELRLFDRCSCGCC